RFDRTGPYGRRPVITLTSVDSEFVGQGSNWPAIARELVHQRRLPREDAEQVEHLYAFGQLIANSDMHNGNLSLLHESYGHFRLAPIYDMLPMRYAPIAGEVATPDFAPPPPVGGLSEAYAAMRGVSREFWQRVAGDSRVSDSFRRVATGNAGRVALI
ncbi:MAG: HipA domain-containing protein, partial [Nevskiales bacterium]